MYNIPRYQTGSYIPGLSSQIFGAGLGRDVASTQEDLRGKAKSLGKKQGWGKFGSWLGSKGGKWAGKALSAGFAATNPLYALAIQAGGAGLGSYLGSKLGRGKDVSLANKHGLLGEQYKDIGKYQRGMESAAKGAAWGDAASVFGEGLKSEAGKSIWGGMDADKKTKWFGENLGSKSHEELSKMRLGNMIGKGRLAQGAEDWLGKFGQKEFETDRLKDTAKWAYGGAKDIYGQYQDYRDYTERNRESSRAGDLSPWERMKMVTGFGGGQQEGGPVGMQEGGSPEEVTPEMYTGMIRKMIGAFGGEEPEGMYTPEGGLTKMGYAEMLGADPESINIDTLSFKNPANYMFKVSGKGAQSGVDVGGTTQSRGILPLKGNILDKVMRENIEDPFERMDLEMMLRKIKPEGYQNGGMAYPLQMAGGGYMPKQGIGGLIQYRKGY